MYVLRRPITCLLTHIHNWIIRDIHRTFPTIAGPETRPQEPRPTTNV